MVYVIEFAYTVFLGSIFSIHVQRKHMNEHAVNPEECNSFLSLLASIGTLTIPLVTFLTNIILDGNVAHVRYGTSIFTWLVITCIGRVFLMWIWAVYNILKVILICSLIIYLATVIDINICSFLILHGVLDVIIFIVLKPLTLFKESSGKGEQEFCHSDLELVEDNLENQTEASGGDVPKMQSDHKL